MSRIEEALKKAQQGNQDGGPALEAPKRSKRRRRTKDEIAKLSYLATVRTNLQFSLTDVERPCVMFCSATRKEGVSTILYYISQLMAAEYRTLVVDSNLLNPSLHEMYEVSNDKGLSDIYLRKASLEDCIQSTRFNGLDILTTGQDPRECFRYMGSATAGKMLKDCRSRYECILIDAPPVRDCPDTAALGAHCDGVVLVIRARKTKKQIVQYVQSQLANAGAHELGVVLNRMKYWVPGFIYRRL